MGTKDQTELSVRTAAFVAENMGLPGIGYEKGCLFTDKYLMRCKCSELGVEIPKYALVDDADDIYNFKNKCGTVVMIKPVDAQASHGITKITDGIDVGKAYEKAVRFSRTKKVWNCQEKCSLQML